MAGKFTQAAHLWREMTQIEFRVKRWHKKYEILNYIESHNFGLNYVLIKSNHTALQTYKVEERTFGTPCSSKRSLSPFQFQLLTIISSFIGTDFMTGNSLCSKIKLSIITLITRYINLATLKLVKHSSVQTLIHFTRTLLLFRFVIASMWSMSL